MSRMCVPSAARAESYGRVRWIGSGKGVKNYQRHGSGFFTAVNPDLLVTAAHVEEVLVARCALNTGYLQGSRPARLSGMGEDGKTASYVSFFHGASIHVGPPLDLDVSTMWVTTKERPLIVSGTGETSPFAHLALAIQTAPPDPKATYFIPVLRAGRFFEFRGTAEQEQPGKGVYKVKAGSWPGYSGSPLFDEDGNVIGVIQSGEGSLNAPTRHPFDVSHFTPFSTLQAMGVFDAFLSRSR